MKKFNKKATLILGTVVLALGVLAIPAFADTTPDGGFNKMNSLMSSGTMQTMHNSPAMQNAMAAGDINSMIDAMNSPEIKAIMGEEHTNQMTELMKNGNMQAMHRQGGMMMGTADSMNWQ